MKAIKNMEKIARVHAEWQPGDVAFIKSLEWSDQNLLASCYCQSRDSHNPWPDLSQNFFELSLKFIRVCDVNVAFSGSPLQHIGSFNIIDLSDNRLEDFNFQIEDYEEGRISFYCQAIEVMDVQAASKLKLDEVPNKTA